MANALYPTAKYSFLKGNIDCLDDTIKVVLLTSAYTYSTAHSTYADLSVVVSTPVEITTTLTTSSSTVTASAGNAVFPDVASGSTVSQYVIYKDTGTASTSSLIAHFDTTATATSGEDIVIAWNASGIFSF